MRFWRFAGLFCVLLFPLTIWGRQTTAPAPQGATVLMQAYSAMVGTGSLSDVTLTGTARRVAGSDDEAGTVALKALATGQSRIDCSFSSGQISEIWTLDSNGNQVGAWVGPDGTSHAMPSHNLMTWSAWFMPALAFGEIVSSQSSNVSYIGPETKDGVSVIHLTITRPFLDVPSDVAALMQHLSQVDVFLDDATLLPVALDFDIHPDNNELLDLPVEIRFSDYRSVSGVKVPFHVQKYLNNGLIFDIQLQAATLNSGLTASTFVIQ
jgi:hypothetical protein